MAFFIKIKLFYIIILKKWRKNKKRYRYTKSEKIERYF